MLCTSSAISSTWMHNHGVTSRHVRLGTRGSPMALWQARWVAEALRQQHPGLTTELVVIRTAGDRNRQDPLPRIGGKGLFVKDIEDALLRQEIELAVHSMKDVPTTLPPGLHLRLCRPGMMCATRL